MGNVWLCKKRKRKTVLLWLYWKCGVTVWLDGPLIVTRVRIFSTINVCLKKMLHTAYYDEAEIFAFDEYEHPPLYFTLYIHYCKMICQENHIWTILTMMFNPVCCSGKSVTLHTHTFKYDTFLKINVLLWIGRTVEYHNHLNECTFMLLWRWLCLFITLTVHQSSPPRRKTNTNFKNHKAKLQYFQKYQTLICCRYQYLKQCSLPRKSSQNV